MLSLTAVPHALKDFFKRIGINSNVFAFRNLNNDGSTKIQIEGKREITQLSILEHEFKALGRDLFLVTSLEEENHFLKALKPFSNESKEYYKTIPTKEFESVRFFIDKDNLLTAFLFRQKEINRFKDYQKSPKNVFKHEGDKKRRAFLHSNYELFFSNSVYEYEIFKIFSHQLPADYSTDNTLNKMIDNIYKELTIDDVFTTLENFCSRIWTDLNFRVNFDTVNVLDTNKREFNLDVGFSFIQNHKFNITFAEKHTFRHTSSTNTTTSFEVELTEEARKELTETFDIFTDDRVLMTQMHCQKVGDFKNKSVYPFKNREHLLIFSNENDIRCYFVFDNEIEENKDDVNALLASKEQFLRDKYKTVLEREKGNRLVFEVLRYRIKNDYFAGRLKEIGTKAINIEGLQKEEPTLISKIKELEDTLFLK